MTNLFIAEKPSVALAIAQALSPSFKREQGYLKGTNGNLYSWAFGHLVELKSPAELDEKFKIWSWDTLPIMPNFEEYKKHLKIINADAAKQLKIIGALAKQATKIYNFCDSAQEGELIFSHIDYALNLSAKPTFRGWTSSLQPDAIKQAYLSAKPNHDYLNLKISGQTRALSDYIIGMNASRAFTLQSHTSGIKQTISLGRIMTPTLALIYDRHMERLNFVKEKFYPIQVTFQQGHSQYQGYLQGERITDLQRAFQLASSIQNKEGTITAINDKTKKTSPPKLFNLTGISKVANQRHKYKAGKTLKILQILYEKRLVSYPRTSSCYVTEAEIPLMHKVADVLASIFPQFAQDIDKSRVNINNKNICNPEKVSDHYALLPEPNIATDLSDEERNIYMIVVERFFMQFQTDYIYQERSIETEVQSLLFKSRYKQDTQLGWKDLLPKSENESAEVEQNDDELIGFPHVQQGEVITVNSQYEERETKPPAAYNDGSLIEIMSNINLRLQDPLQREALKEKGIGTDATRAHTIEKLEKLGYIKYEKNNITITDLGIAIIEMLRKTKVNALTSPEMTAQWELELKNIQSGASPIKFQQGIIKFTHLILNEAKQANFNYSEKSIGQCPVCKGELKESPKTYFCTNKEGGCKFFLWSTQYGKKITLTMLNQLLTKGQTSTITLKKVNKETYKGKLVLQTSELNGKLNIKM